VPLSEALAAAGHSVSYAILRPTLQTCIGRAAARSGYELSNPDVIAHLWSDFADVGPLETHVIDVEDVGPGQVANTVIGRYRAGALRI
jgi:hypothetical protein